MKPYVVKQGDHLTKLAHKLGFDADTVWNDSKNAELKKTRKPDILKAGDVLWVPDEPPKKLALTAQSKNAFVAKVPKVAMKIALADGGKPLADEPYEIQGLGPETKGTTDGDGNVKFEADVHVKEVFIVLPKRKTSFRVLVAGMDPIDEASGQKMRLANLGFYAPKFAGAGRDETRDDAQLGAALKAFQAAKGIEPTGVADDATKTALTDAHGS